MPDKKKHHYVPRFYLKRFSDNSGRTINLFNINKGMAIPNASLRHQCCEPYFYGKTPEMENTFEEHENFVSRIIDEMLLTKTVPARHLSEYGILLVHVIMQCFRTKRAAQEHDEIIDGLAKIMLHRQHGIDIETLDSVRIVTSNPTAAPLLIAARVFPLALDLHATVISNRSKEAFVTSDNPVVFYNQYMENFQGPSCTGLVSQGLQVFLPLSPDIMFHLFDSAIYRIRSKGGVCEIHDGAEALKLNQLQWLNALENVYYSMESTSDSIARQAGRFLPGRPVKEPLVNDYPTGRNESIFVIHRPDLNIHLRPSFVTILKSKKRLRHLLQRPEDRDPKVVQDFASFTERMGNKPYSGNDFLPFLPDDWVFK